MSRLLNNQSRRISIYRLQRRSSFGFESSVSSTSLTNDDPVGLPAVYQVNLGEPVPTVFLPPLIPDWKRSFGDKWPRFFKGQMLIWLPNQQCQITRGNSKHWTQPVAWSYPFFMYHLKEGALVPLCQLSNVSSMTNPIQNCFIMVALCNRADHYIFSREKI